MTRRRSSCAVLVLCALALTACTGGDPSDPPTSVPPTVAATPTAIPTPPETDGEREEREAYEEAEAAYRAFMAEIDRISKAGGAAKPTKVMKQYGYGPWLEFYEKTNAEQKRRRQFVTPGKVDIAWIRREGFSDEEITLKACEDGSASIVRDDKGKQVSEGQIALVTLYLRKNDGRWMLWDADDELTESCL